MFTYLYLFRLQFILYTAGARSSTESPRQSSVLSASAYLKELCDCRRCDPCDIWKTVEEIIKDWNSKLQDRAAKFRKQATAIAEYMLMELSRRKKNARIKPDEDFDVFMKRAWNWYSTIQPTWSGIFRW
ncbi:hypothetical protein J5N97_026792 [Dioscorea zingiberensis]|uniref:Uncharacterized protein n=1 Tax=Dioscorea zingiberensis TaxID=325984 RepID=A0A9D5C3Y8_9LILI|nr:hypothetical protein J5N97_026792 [Dioscorea zingiberensis]